MSESIWWPDEAWWERKSLPLGFITLSFRQLGTILLSFLTAFVVSLPFEFAIAGASFGGRAAVFCIVFGVGFVISSRRVKLLPIELQTLYFLRTEGLAEAKMKLLEQKKLPTDHHVETGRQSSLQEISVEDFKNPIPLTVSEAVKGVQNETRVLLFLDNELRGEGIVSPQRPRFRLSYLPLQLDVGRHLLRVRLDGSTEPLVSFELLVQGRSMEVGESITRMKRHAVQKEAVRRHAYVRPLRAEVGQPGKSAGEGTGVRARQVRILPRLPHRTHHVPHLQDEREVEAIGALYQIPYKRFFLETHSQVDSLVQKLGTRMARVHALSQIIPARVYSRFIVDSEGRYVQTYCITRLGCTLVPGFLAELYQITYCLMLDIDPIDIYEAK